MSRTKLVSLLLVIFALGGAVGAWAAYEYFLREGVRGMTAFGDLSVMALQEQRANLERDAGNASQHEQALRDYLVILDKMATTVSSENDSAGVRMSRVVTLARLAQLVENRGATDEAHHLTETAIVSCKAIPSRDCSAEKIRELAVYFNRPRLAQAAPGSK
jgi:hypothetical protein